MSNYPDYLTASDFYQFVNCPHWPYYERFATDEEKTLRRQVTDSEKHRQENGLAHELDVVKELMKDQQIDEVPVTRNAEADWEATRALMAQGVPLIYQGTLTSGDWTGRPDLLERHDGASVFGDWHYVPVDVKSTHFLEKYQKLQLSFYAALLEKLQGRFPAEPAIINRDGERIPFAAGDFVADFELFVVELERIRAGEKPDPVLRKSCFDTGVWGTVCERFAKSTNDIALLYNVNVEKLKTLRALGVRSVEDAAEMDPMALDGVAKGLRLHGLEVMKRQAQALKDCSVLVREPVVLPNPPLEIHFDIESDPPFDRDYLYGFLVRRPEGDEYISFVAETHDGEKQMWESFLAWIKELPSDYVVYHFSSYELTRLGTLAKRYGTEDDQWLAAFQSHMVDLKEITTHAITFPLYFYGLKYIAKFLGFSWRSDVKGGSQSIDVFEKFLATHDRALLDSIILYNEDDVRATAHLKDWLVKYAKNVSSYGKPYPWTI
ncbi:MAG: TM0106 family RecB-like putative nuclease [Patescibacteria group bacterium]